MHASPDTVKFAEEWFDLAKKVVERIALDSEIMGMKKDFLAHKSLSLEQKSRFIAITNRIKYELIHELYGADGTDSFIKFSLRWREWYDSKGVLSDSQFGRRLTNEDHIIYSSTPEAEEFFRNMEILSK